MSTELWVALGATIVSAIGVCVGGFLQRRAIGEMHRSWVERDRPFLFASIETGDPPLLRIQNVGARSAFRVTVSVSEPIRDEMDRPIVENPQLKDGFPLIPPGYQVVVKLAKDSSIDNILFRSDGGDMHPTICLEYSDESGNQHYSYRGLIPMDTDLDKVYIERISRTLSQ